MINLQLSFILTEKISFIIIIIIILLTTESSTPRQKKDERKQGALYKHIIFSSINWHTKLATVSSRTSFTTLHACVELGIVGSFIITRQYYISTDRSHFVLPTYILINVKYPEPSCCCSS